MPTETPDYRPPPDKRSPGGSNYGDAVPGAHRDPSKGAEMERDALPPDADFSQPPVTQQPLKPAP